MLKKQCLTFSPPFPPPAPRFFLSPSPDDTHPPPSSSVIFTLPHRVAGEGSDHSAEEEVAARITRRDFLLVGGAEMFVGVFFLAYPPLSKKGRLSSTLFSVRRSRKHLSFFLPSFFLVPKTSAKKKCGKAVRGAPALPCVHTRCPRIWRGWDSFAG